MPLGADADRVPVSPGRLFATHTTLLLACVVIAALTVSADLPTAGRRMAFGFALLVVVTAFVGVATWDRPWARWVVIVLPLVDLFAVSQLRAASPTSGFGFLLMLPVAWLALNSGRRGALIGVSAATIAAWAPLALGDLGFSPGGVGAPSLAATASLNVAMLVVGGVIASSHDRSGQYVPCGKRLANVFACAMSSPAAAPCSRIRVRRSSGANGLPFSMPSCRSMARWKRSRSSTTSDW